MRKGSKAILWTIVAAMALVTLVQWVMAFRGGGDAPEDAKRMLYEASLFQVELLAGHAAQASGASSTGELNGLKQAAYSVEFTHERLARASGEAVPELQSVSTLMEFLVRLQIGGERRLKPEEAERLAAASPYFAELHDAYGQLFGEGGAFSVSAAERIRLADEQIEGIFNGE